MAGITIATIAASVLAAATAVDKTATGFIVGQRATLGTSPAGSNYTWGLSRPSDSSARADLTDTSAATPSFLLEVAGVYIVTCTVDGTAYTLTITVTEPAVATIRNAINFPAVADANVPTPVSGVTVYYSSEESALVQKDTSGVISIVDITPA